jgi:hypothetical protein
MGVERGVLEGSSDGEADVALLVERDRLGEAPNPRRAQGDVLVREHLLPRVDLACEAKAPVVSRDEPLADSIAKLHRHVR